MRKFTADFETTTDINDCRVWAYGICEIGNPDYFIYGNNIEDFINYLKENENAVYYFHNLKFDGEFIISYLLNNGFTYFKDKKDRKSKTFTTLISDMGQFYSIEIFFEIKDNKHINKATLYDSLKILNFSVEQIAKDFNLPISKLKIDYNAKREIGHTLTNDEVDYLRNDVEIMARALKFMFDKNLNKMTIGSNALNNYKEFNTNFRHFFPELDSEIDGDIRKSYKGGFTYLNPIHAEELIEDGLVLDVNSLYPSVMKYSLLPYGLPLYFNGKYKENNIYPLYVQRISCSFELKKNKIPTIQIKNSLSFIPNEYLESSDGDIVTLTLTNIDLKLFLENYETFNLVYHDGYMFKGMTGLFNDYIEYWYNEKNKAKKENNPSLYTIAKLMLNSLYGKFATSTSVRSKYPFLEDGIVKYKFHDKEDKKPVYIPMGSFITSYAREKTIRSSQKIRDYSLKNYGEDYYIYSDTDSIHLKYINPDELKNILDIDDYNLGDWKIENNFTHAKFLRQKCYIEEINEKINVTMAGFPKRLAPIINFDNFKIGFTTETIDKKLKDEYGTKFRFMHVKGGIILAETDFTIK